MYSRKVSLYSFVSLILTSSSLREGNSGCLGGCFGGDGMIFCVVSDLLVIWKAGEILALDSSGTS